MTGDNDCHQSPSMLWLFKKYVTYLSKLEGMLCVGIRGKTGVTEMIICTNNTPAERHNIFFKKANFSTGLAVYTHNFNYM